MTTRFEKRCEKGRRVHGSKFVPPTGDAFIDAYNKGWQYRIKVETAYPCGHKDVRWGYVVMTTGWVPAFLLMRSVSCTGSSDLLDPKKDLVVQSKWLKERKK